MFPDLCLLGFWLPLTFPLLILPLLRDGPQWARLCLAGCAQLFKELLWHRPRWPVRVCIASTALSTHRLVWPSHGQSVLGMQGLCVSRDVLHTHLNLCSVFEAWFVGFIAYEINARSNAAKLTSWFVRVLPGPLFQPLVSWVGLQSLSS